MHQNFSYRLKSISHATYAALGLLALTNPGCSQGEAPDQAAEGRIQVDRQGAALTAVENTESALNGVVDSGEFLADSTSLATTLSALGGSSESCSGSATVCPADDATCVPEVTEVCTTDEVTEEDLQSARDELREEVNKLVQRLKDEVFIAANIVEEETNDTQVTYRLGASLLCDPGDVQPTQIDEAQDGAEPAPAELDPECVENAEKANLRVTLSQPNPDDVDITFVVSDDNYKPLTLQLYKDRLGVKVDLAEALETLDAMGEDVDAVDSLEGVLQLQLIKNKNLDYSLQFSIVEDFNLSFHDDDGRDFVYAIGKTSPTVELRADGNTKTLEASYNYGAIQLLAPLSAIAGMFEDESVATEPSSNGDVPSTPPPEEKVYTGVIELLVAGYTGKFSYTADTDKFSFTNVSLGNKTSTLKHDGNLLASLDLNPEDGRGFDMVVQTDPETESALVSIDPTIDLNLALSFEAIADQVENIPSTLLNDKLRMWFEGNNPTFAAEGEQMRMVSGSFHMSSEQSPESNIDVGEGMCMMSTDADSVEVTPAEGSPEPAEPMFDVQVGSCQ